jgi:hypothetical protein
VALRHWALGLPELIHYRLDQQRRDGADGEDRYELDQSEVLITGDAEKGGGRQDQENGQYGNAFLGHGMFCALNIVHFRNGFKWELQW